MIVFFGPAGAGKSMQGQMLAARHGWRWLSMGQIMRDTHDPELFKIMQEGKLVPDSKTNEIIADNLDRVPDTKYVILDGYPRNIGQARWLIESQGKEGRTIDLAIVLEVSRVDIMKRLVLRGRADDTPEIIDERLRTYRKEVYPILNYFTEQDINIVHIDGSGTVGQVHDKIMEELVACQIV